MNASVYITGIESLFNEAISQIRHMSNPRAGGLASVDVGGMNLPRTDSDGNVKRVPNAFGGYNLVSKKAVEAMVISDTNTLRMPASQGSLDVPAINTVSNS